MTKKARQDIAKLWLLEEETGLQSLARCMVLYAYLQKFYSLHGLIAGITGGIADDRIVNYIIRRHW